MDIGGGGIGIAHRAIENSNA
ncbi:uncharacterized protein G2W53_026103 [Senna tora]|uniref:Uncharacterized protein n=1 Tax=Senna tora TaxID=362788 RepID=A0A834TEH2_9FABA|nr:uncharacterized protein G2W53_026103 [Senna tora]